uniref:Uncharacterized protein n=1 Tax=Parascaris univalens TaxID=6257 RepID=A0A915AKT1_PARUN
HFHLANPAQTKCLHLPLQQRGRSPHDCASTCLAGADNRLFTNRHCALGQRVSECTYVRKGPLLSAVPSIALEVEGTKHCLHPSIGDKP